MKDLEDRRFTGLLEAAPDAMICVDGDGRIALVNAQAERLFGYGREELGGERVGKVGAGTAGRSWSGSWWTCWCRMRCARCTRAAGPATWPIRSRGRWARGWSWPGG